MTFEQLFGDPNIQGNEDSSIDQPQLFEQYQRRHVNPNLINQQDRNNNQQQNQPERNRRSNDQSNRTQTQQIRNQQPKESLFKRPFTYLIRIIEYLFQNKLYEIIFAYIFYALFLTMIKYFISEENILDTFFKIFFWTPLYVVKYCLITLVAC